jgi:hypothetical protein
LHQADVKCRVQIKDSDVNFHDQICLNHER